MLKSLLYFLEQKCNDLSIHLSSTGGQKQKWNFLLLCDTGVPKSGALIVGSFPPQSRATWPDDVYEKSKIDFKSIIVFVQTYMHDFLTHLLLLFCCRSFYTNIKCFACFQHIQFKSLNLFRTEPPIGQGRGSFPTFATHRKRVGLKQVRNIYTSWCWDYA